MTKFNGWRAFTIVSKNSAILLFISERRDIFSSAHYFWTMPIYVYIYMYIYIYIHIYIYTVAAVSPIESSSIKVRLA